MKTMRRKTSKTTNYTEKGKQVESPFCSFCLVAYEPIHTFLGVGFFLQGAYKQMSDVID